MTDRSDLTSSGDGDNAAAATAADGDIADYSDWMADGYGFSGNLEAWALMSESLTAVLNDN